MNPPSSMHEQIIPTARLIALELRHALSQQADRLGENATDLLDTLHSHRAKPLANAQINGLLSVANTARSTSSIIKFLRRQGARRETWQQDDLAKLLLQHVNDLEQEAIQVAKQVQQDLRNLHGRSGDEIDALCNKRKRLPEVHHLLVLEFIQSFVTGYLYMYGSDND